ncbi:MAG: DUF1631 family protein [Rubrivivax sp.]|nr:DUF1631 family protein [Rubrivivax sp.]
MVVPQVPRVLLQFVDDEMLRAPLLFDQLIESTRRSAREAMVTMGPLQHSAMAELVQALRAHQSRLAEYFLHSLREQVNAELLQSKPPPPQQRHQPQAWALVDEDEVALDVEMSHTVEAIKSTAEHELLELQTYTSALVGDPDVTRDHNPFRAETFARALWDTAQALPMSRGHQVAFVRYAGPALAQLLRMSYAATTSRLEQQGLEPAAYRTVILPPGARRNRFGETTIAPDLQRMRETMPAPLEGDLSYEGQKPDERPRDQGRNVAGETTTLVDRQAVELVSRLFDAMAADERVPADVSLLIARLHGPVMRLTLRDGSLLDQDAHPLWRFINRLAFEAEMVPDTADPVRVQLLKTAQATVDQLTNEPEQNAGLYGWAMERLESFLGKRLVRRLSAASSHIGALQRLEDTLCAGQTSPSTMHGTLDVAQLDTVPADLLADPQRLPAGAGDGQAWLEELQPGDWVRMFLQGRWVHSQLLWPGERQEIWLFGDGASDATWAVRRGALLLMREQALLKKLQQRSIVGSAAARVQEQMAAAAAA